MRARRTFRRSAAALAIALTSTSGAFAQCEQTESQWQRVEINLGSGIPAPIVKNAGHLGEAAFGAVSAAGTAARFAANGRVDLVISLETDFARVGFEPVDTDGAVALTPTEPLWGSVIYLSPTMTGELAAWGALEARGLWGSAVVEHRVTGRTWRTRVTGEAGDLSRFALRPTGVAEIVSDEASHELAMALQADPERQLTLFPAKARLGDEVIHIPFVADGDGTLRLDGEVPEGAELEILMVFAPYYHAGDAVADGRGGYVAAGAAVDAVEAGGGSGRDVAVVRTAGDGHTFLGMTVLASSGDDSAAGIASRVGDAFVVGSAGADDFPLDKNQSGDFPAPFAIRLGSDGIFGAGSYLRPHGLETGFDVAVDATGRVLLAGAATAGAKDRGEMELTAVMPLDEAAPKTVYAVAELDAELGFAERVQTFEGATTGLPMEIRASCETGISVGLPPVAEALFNCLSHWNKHDYPSHQPAPWSFWYYDGYADVMQPGPLTDSWGYHALKWKDFHDLSTTYSALAASMASPLPPIRQVTYYDNLRLNALEANASVFTPGNPAGVWLRNDAYDYLELAIGAAAYAAFWNSPTYANLRYDSGLPGGGFATGAVAITETEFCSQQGGGSGGMGPIQLCQAIACANPPCAFPIDDWDDVCAADPVISDTSKVYLNGMTYSHWDPARGGYAEGEEEIYWLDVQTRFNQAALNRYYVADPPVGAEFARSFVAEGVQRELARVVEDVAVEITTFAGGRAVSSETGYGLVRAVDR